VDGPDAEGLTKGAHGLYDIPAVPTGEVVGHPILAQLREVGVGHALGFGLDQHQKAMTAARARAEA